MPPAADDIDTSFVDRAVELAGRGPESAIPILQMLQGHYGYLPEAALRRVRRCQPPNRVARESRPA